MEGLVDENMLNHVVVESLGVEVRVHAAQVCFALTQNPCLREMFKLFEGSVVSEVVDNGNMVDVMTAGAVELVTLFGCGEPGIHGLLYLGNLFFQGNIFNCKQDRVVNELALLQKNGVIVDDLSDLGNVFFIKLKEAVAVLVSSEVLGEQQVLVLLDELVVATVPSLEAAFEVVDGFDVVLMIEFDGVGHQHKVNGVQPFHLDLEDPIDSNQKTVSVVIKVHEVVLELKHKSIKFTFKHGFDNELTIV